MDIRRITDDYAVSPQIAPTDVAAIRAAGFGTILCNRPDAEVPAELSAAEMRRAAEAEGLAFVVNPVTHQGLNDEMVRLQAETLDAADAPVLAYCASGTRSSIVWALGQAGRRDPDEIVDLAAKAGYDLAGLRPRLG
ncbi:TIGR01244 family sulfur transferase [Wenxinia saemankumensis]|uniref:TIGR01244 family protein n=1 Tax=Wenxinia saemankumensis TaxID=1447782 RepID=A0A1M6HI98_9RHOB|nr:TIGR01244 family sulfur transferase [Wenxinia saemankumensis]SHJ21931.1 TIGR01244 family protein [Wenxinia saemankumensis]